MSSNQPPRSADEVMQFAETPAEPRTIVFKEEVRTSNLLRRAKERNQEQGAFTAQIGDSRAHRSFAKKIILVLEAIFDWFFGFSRWLKQRPKSRHELALLQTAQAATHKVENLWQRHWRRLHSERVEVLRFNRNPGTLTYDLERCWTLHAEVVGNIPSYTMATVAIRRFGRVTASIRDIQLEDVGLKIRLTRRKGLTLFRLKDESGDIALLTEAVAILLLSQYEGKEPLSLKQLADRLDAQSNHDVERPVYQASAQLRQRINADWQLLRQCGLLHAAGSRP